MRKSPGHWSHQVSPSVIPDMGFRHPHGGALGAQSADS